MKKIFGLLKKGVRKIMELNNEAIRAKTELEIKKLEIVEHIADKSIDMVKDSVRGTVGLAGKTITNTGKTINSIFDRGINMSTNTCKAIKRNPVIFMGVGVGIGVGVVIVGGSILLQNKMLNAVL